MPEKKTTHEELIETLKNGPMGTSEALLIANGKTVRISIAGIQIQDSWDTITSVTLEAYCISDPRELAELIYGGMKE